MVAKGKYGGYVNQTSKIWDNVAAQILLEEAGCIYTDLLGKKIDYSNPLMKAKDNFTFCTAPAVLHKQLQSIIQRHY
jgi:myo-inositol-1(or 4)-monophosphatase